MGFYFSCCAGVCWFDYFFAGITSSLAMGTPWMGFMRDEFGWSKIKELGLWSNDFSFRFTNSYFFKEGVFDEYDY
jgi:SNF family Na+-dependent transporter